MKLKFIARILIGIIALLHLYIAWMEMFAWESRGPNVFKSLPEELFASTKVMAANQGLYNAFLAAGLLWTFFIKEQKWANSIAIFFLGCIAVAGLYGAATLEQKIAYIQTVPALITIALLLGFREKKAL